MMIPTALSVRLRSLSWLFSVAVRLVAAAAYVGLTVLLCWLCARTLTGSIDARASVTLLMAMQLMLTTLGAYAAVRAAWRARHGWTLVRTIEVFTGSAMCLITVADQAVVVSVIDNHSVDWAGAAVLLMGGLAAQCAAAGAACIAYLMLAAAYQPLGTRHAAPWPTALRGHGGRP